MNIQFMKMFKKYTEGSSFCHLCECIHILREALSAITKFTIGTWNVSVCVVNISREQHTCMYFTPIAAHFLAVLTTSIEISYFVSTKYIMHILSKFCL